MPDYEKLYFKLFNDVTDIIERLKQIQQKAEDEYIKGKICFEVLQKGNKE